MALLTGFIGSRSLPLASSPLVSSLVSAFLARGFSIASGGAIGADQYALSAIIQQQAAPRGVVFSAWSSVSGFPASVRPSVARFMAGGGQVVWGSCLPGSPRQQVVSALLGRNQHLVAACSRLVAFLHGPSRGTLFTIRQAVKRGIPVYVVLCGAGAAVPADLARHCFIVRQEEVH